MTKSYLFFHSNVTDSGLAYNYQFHSHKYMGFVFNSSLNFIKNKIDLTISSSYSSYVGDHFGEVIWARTFSSNGKIRDRYYEGLGEKKDLSFFTKLLYSIDEKIEF